jgi:hypothetical protein
MRYICLVYFDPRKLLDMSPEDKAALDRDSGDYDKQLDAAGHLVVAEALKSPREAMTVQVRDGRMSTTDGPFMETKEVLGGFILVQARDLNEAVRIAAGIPLAKLGSIEVRPIVIWDEPKPSP